jgi:endonuclease-3
MARDKLPHDIDEMLRRVAVAVAPYPKAAMFELADEGFRTAFEQLVACIISIRTYDEVSLVAARRLFARARTPAAIAGLPVAEIDRLIAAATFHDRKAIQIRDIAREVETRFGGTLPCDRDLMLSFAGVGPKCANLALGIACGQRVISVDIHVHRITNRWGYVRAANPDATLAALGRKLPEKYWVEINRLLVPFGKHICTGQLPRCSTCPVLEFCQQAGVTQPR